MRALTSRPGPGSGGSRRREETTVTDTGQAPTHAPGQAPRHAPARDDDIDTTTAWTAWVVFAAVMMMMVGGFHALTGFIALFQDDYFVTTSSGLAIDVDYSQWGWTHLIIGALVLVAGIAVLSGQLWARVVGVALAALSAFANMFFIAAYPLWSVIIITIDVLTIYALTVHGREMRSLTRGR
jgi:hypothetical protein